MAREEEREEGEEEIIWVTPEEFFEAIDQIVKAVEVKAREQEIQTELKYLQITQKSFLN